MGSITFGLDQLAVGKVISYTLPRSMRPTTPDKIWRGRIINVYRTRLGDISGFNVECLETGYEGLQELVFPYQIVV
jgi:hypothetical protein